MSWNGETEMKCKNCGKTYTGNLSTLEMASKFFGLCDSCKENTKGCLTDIKITPHKPGDGGILCLPLKSNIPNPKNSDWKLVNCPICGAECWESELARETINAEERLTASCTACAIKANNYVAKLIDEGSKDMDDFIKFMESESEAFKAAGIKTGRVEFICPLCGGKAIGIRELHHGRISGMGSGCLGCKISHT